MTYTRPRPEFVGEMGKWLDYEKCMVCGLGYDTLADRAQVNIDNGISIRCLYFHRRHRYVTVEVGHGEQRQWVSDTRSDIDLRNLVDAFMDAKLEIGWE